MLVAFIAHAVFTEALQSGQTQNFPKHLEKEKEPFQRIQAIGGGDKWRFEGVLDIRPLKQKKRIAYEITASLVPKVETLARVGVESVDFEKIDPQHFE